MNNLSMTEPELQRLLKVFFYLTLIVWLGVGALMWGLGSGEFDIILVFRSLSPALFISGVIYALVYQASWKYAWIAKLMNRPIVHGVWCGELVSDYKASEGMAMHVPIVFIIRQTYLSLSVQTFTPTQIGSSTLEGLVQDARTRDTRLRYVFKLEREFRHENKLTKGSGELRLQNQATELRGNYWTSTPTHGELRLTLVSRDCEDVDSFAMAVKRWPDKIELVPRTIPLCPR